MRRLIVVPVFFVSQVFGQTFTPIPAKDNILNNFVTPVPTPGCSCGIGPNATKPQLKSIQFSPKDVSTTKGQAVQLRYDASAMCRGQSVRDEKEVLYGDPKFSGVGTIEWQPGTIQRLPELAGIVTFPGYSQSKTYLVRLTISVQCYDTGTECKKPQKYTACTAQAVIPVVVK